MFEVRIVGKNFQKEARMSEEELAGYVSKFVISQTKTMGFAKTTTLSEEETLHWHLRFISCGSKQDCQNIYS